MIKIIRKVVPSGPKKLIIIPKSCGIKAGDVVLVQSLDLPNQEEIVDYLIKESEKGGKKDDKVYK